MSVDKMKAIVIPCINARIIKKKFPCTICTDDELHPHLKALPQIVW